MVHIRENIRNKTQQKNRINERITRCMDQLKKIMRKILKFFELHVSRKHMIDFENKKGVKLL